MDAHNALPVISALNATKHKNGNLPIKHVSVDRGMSIMNLLVLVVPLLLCIARFVHLFRFVWAVRRATFWIRGFV